MGVIISVCLGHKTESGTEQTKYKKGKTQKNTYIKGIPLHHLLVLLPQRFRRHVRQLLYVSAEMYQGSD
eukprot:m.33856 g.33856  ORF g.33856 m.33856 type:complete len:69 (-) comp10939_c0_seq1:367-573(-)